MFPFILIIMSSIHFVRTHAGNTDFVKLVQLLDADLTVKDGEDHAFYHQFNGLEAIDYALVLYSQEIAIGCGGLKSFDNQGLEIKRMYVNEESRGLGLGSKILNALEKWTVELGYTYCYCETGKRQPDAIALYIKNGYTIIPNYGPYQGVTNSICFQKRLT